MKRSTLVVVLCLVLAAGGCFPRQLIVWDPEGKTAAVILNDELRFCDVDGVLTAPVAEGVKLVRWFHDGKRLLMTTETTADTWDAVVAAIGDQRAAELVGHAEALKRRLVAGVPWAAEIKAYQSDNGLDDHQRDAILLYLRSRHLDELRQILPVAEAHLASQPKLHALVVRGLTDGTLGPPTPLAGSVSTIGDAVIAPDDGAVAFTSESSERLAVVATDGSAGTIEVAEEVARQPDWTPDGRALVYIHALGDAQALARRTVRDERGSLLAELKEPDQLAILAAAGEARVRCLRDGRILFTAIEISLPIAPKDISPKAHLFVVDPARRATVARMIPRSVVDEHLRDTGIDYFDLSPDQSRVAIPAPDGRVLVLTLATGEVVVAQPVADPDKKFDMLPAWRTNTELTCLAPAKARGDDAPRPEIVLWSATGTRTLSTAWPDELLDPFRPKKENDDE